MLGHWDCSFGEAVQHQDKPLVKCRIKQLRELLFNRIWPVCWVQHCKACCHVKMMENQVSPIHHGWASVGAGLWARESCPYQRHCQQTPLGTMMQFYHISFFLPNLSEGFMGRLFIKPCLVHRDLIRYSLNIIRRINYHCCTRATEEVKCFSFAWAESICLKCSQYHQDLIKTECMIVMQEIQKKLPAAKVSSFLIILQ